jgi:hypothetical protein
VHGLRISYNLGSLTSQSDIIYIYSLMATYRLNDSGLTPGMGKNFSHFQSVTTTGYHLINTKTFSGFKVTKTERLVPSPSSSTTVKKQAIYETESPHSSVVYKPHLFYFLTMFYL